MKKKFIYGICFCLWAFLATTNAFGQQSWGQAGDFQYNGDGFGTAVSIYKYVGSDASVVIPATIIGLPVTGIGGAFTDNTTLTSVTIPTSVTTIGGSAFSGCTGLTSITIPNSVTTIGAAFTGCTGLTSITIPASVTSLNTGAFKGCTALTSIDVDASNPNYSSIDGVVYNKAGNTLVIFPWGKSSAFTVPGGVTTIGTNAFQDCTSLTSITIPSGVTTIQATAFNNTGLTSVNIPDSVTSILAGAFRKCASLTSITVDASNPNFSSLDGVLYNKLQTTLVQYPAGIAGAFTVPTSVTTIGANSFTESALITSVSIPASVTTINANALRNCPALTSIVVDAGNPNYSSLDGVLYNKLGTTIILFPGGIAGAFTIPSGVTAIADQAFQSCPALTSVIIPNGVTTIGTFAFSGSEALTSVTIPNTVTTIKLAAFTGCTGLTSITIPASVTTIGQGTLDRSTLWDCTALPSITVDAGNPNYSSLDGVMYNKLQTELIQYPGGKPDSAFTVPSSVTTIANSAFRSNVFLTSVTIPDSVTSMGTFVFNKCTGLTSVTIGNGMLIIGISTFQGCTGLTSVTIGNSVTTIGGSAFSGCTGLTSITLPASVTTIGTNASNTNVFNGCKNLSSVSFLGNAPTLNNINAFFGTTSDFHVCYTAVATGFSNPWKGYPASTCEPPATTTTTVPATTTTTVPPTLISLSSFDAKAIWRFVILTWKTESEINNAEFNIYRAESEDGEYVKINSSLIPAKGSTTEGASYRYIDLTTKRGTTYYYKLEDVDLSGIATMHGPVSATPGWISGLRK